MRARALSGAFANAKERAAVAAEETAHKAKKTKVNREIKLLQKKISKIKHEFGPHIYDAMLDAINGNIGPEVDQLFNEARAKVDELNSEIESKRAMIESKREQIAERKRSRSMTAISVTNSSVNSSTSNLDVQSLDVKKLQDMVRERKEQLERANSQFQKTTAALEKAEAKRLVEEAAKAKAAEEAAARAAKAAEEAAAAQAAEEAAAKAAKKAAKKAAAKAAEDAAAAAAAAAAGAMEETLL